MSGGILAQNLPQGQGLLGGLNQFAQDNSAALLGLGAGLLSGDWGAGAQGYAQGMAQDERTRLIRLKQAEEERQKVALQQAAQKLGIDPVLAQASPELVATVASRKYAPKELSFEQQQFNMLSPEQQSQYREQKFLGGDGKSLTEQYRQRAQMAQQQGLKPGDPAYQSFVLTGKMPREDAQPLTATDKKAIMEADEGVMSAENALASIERAKQLSKKAYDGFGAGVRGTVTGVFGSESGQATTELDNEVTGNALQQMKAIFGGNPTEGERAILLEIQGSSNMPAAVRERIYDKAKVLVQRRLEFNRQRAAQMRGGEYYKPQGQGAQTQQQPNAQGAIQVDGYTIRQR